MTPLVHIDQIQRNPDSVVTVGTFDGVHQGHRELISTLVSRTRAAGCRSVVVTFDPHPREILQPGTPGLGLLTTVHERAEILSNLGVDVVAVIPFNRDFSLMGSAEFIESFIFGKIGLRHFIIGYDHHFGHNREGDSQTLTTLGQRLGFEVEIVQALELGDKAVSSSVARRALMSEGNTELVKQLLDRAYLLEGIVVHGDARGRQIGFPTANIKVSDPRKIMPKTGVYAVRVEVAGSIYPGMANIGVRPTFGGDPTPSLEVHILGFDRDIYGMTARIHFESRIRDEVRFSGVEALRSQLEADRVVATERLK